MFDFNEVTIVLGRRGMGKSTYALGKALQVSRMSYVLVWDPTNGGFPIKHPSDPDVVAIRYKSLGDAVGAIRSRGAGVHVVSDRHVSPLALLEMCEKIASTGKQRGHGTPCTLVLDESVLTYTLHGKAEDQFKAKLLEIVFTGRHMRVGLIFVGQHANLIDYRALGEATSIVMFHTNDVFCLTKLRMAGVPEDLLARLPSLKPHEYLEFKP